MRAEQAKTNNSVSIIYGDIIETVMLDNWVMLPMQFEKYLEKCLFCFRGVRENYFRNQIIKQSYGNTWKKTLMCTVFVKTKLLAFSTLQGQAFKLLWKM